MIKRRTMLLGAAGTIAAFAAMRWGLPTDAAPAGKFEIESADDFVLTAPTAITSATFTGLLTGGDGSQYRRSSRRDLPGVSSRFECWPDQRAAHFLDTAGPHPGQFAIGCGIRRSRYIASAG